MSRRGRNNDVVDGQEDDAQETHFEISRTWESLDEVNGRIIIDQEDEAERRRQRRLQKDTTPFQRGIIRHLIIVLDMSLAMNEKDLRPTRYFLTLNYTIRFIREYFEQNPISQLGIVAMRNGVAEQVSDMSGNPTEHIRAVEKRRAEECKGSPSLENALEMARAALFHAPSHGTRELLLIMGALHSVDPGDIHRTIDSLVADRIRAKVIGLAAQVAICQELVRKTNNGDTKSYSIVTHEEHFLELYMEITTPPTNFDQVQSTTNLLMMGFPSRTVDQDASLCACHARPCREAYLCSRCSTKVCGLPSECPACGLTLILSTHLARSYHHLFPLVNWTEVPWSRAFRSKECFACQLPFPVYATKGIRSDQIGKENGSKRYECPSCRAHFCIDCDQFCHEIVHNCPGCQSGFVQRSSANQNGIFNGAVNNSLEV